jgi:hypothetical protein
MIWEIGNGVTQSVFLQSGGTWGVIAQDSDVFHRIWSTVVVGFCDGAPKMIPYADEVVHGVRPHPIDVGGEEDYRAHSIYWGASLTTNLTPSRSRSCPLLMPLS